MPHDVNSFLRPIIKRAQEGENVEYERVGASADGQRRWMHGRIAPDLDATGKVRGLYCTEYDIHDLKLTEQALATREEQLRLFTDNIPEPVVYVDMDRQLHLRQRCVPASGRHRPRRGHRQDRSRRCSDPRSSNCSSPSSTARRKGESVTYEREHIDVNGRQRWLRNRIVPDMRFDGTIKGYYIVGHDITDLQAGAERAGGARIAVARDHGRRSGAGGVYRSRRALPVRQPAVSAVLRTDRGAGRRAAPARRGRPRHLRQRAGDAVARAARRVDLVRSPRSGRGRREAVDDHPRGARRDAGGRGARRVRADERHPWPQAGAGSVARQRGRAAADHGQRAGARGLHRSRIPLSVPEPAQRGMAFRKPQGPDRPAGRRGRRRGADAAVAAAADASARRRDDLDRAAPRRSPTASSAGNRCTSRPTAMPRATSSASTRRTPTSTTRSATRKRCTAPTGCFRRTSTTRRWRCWSGTATFALFAGRRRRRTSSAGAPRRCSACRSAAAS